ncbi:MULTISPECIES: protealysin inhibitor emfourin [unclassified Salinibacterium]|uniref:protealysin inhibitor emfourin n=1 Tax=unclassified Salinibacterium TaxID=2632331 RepID=UPI00141F246A|nr:MULTISPECIES: protealysin inhibitor emfourin [unclassified Salinibacterium]
MKVIVVRTGGFAGLRATWELQVDDQPDAPRWSAFLHDLPWDDVPPAPQLPDRYIYRIRCEPHEVVLTEPQVQGPWRELVDRVRAANEESR